MKDYSQDLRLRVLRAIDAGASQSQVAEQFAVSVATIKRYLKQRRETGHVTAKVIPGRPAVIGAALLVGLREQLEANPDATREQHCQMWEEKTGIKVSTASITRARQALCWTRKKIPYSKRAERNSACCLACTNGSPVEPGFGVCG